MKHILFALEGFFPDNIGGTENYVLNLAKELRKNGYKISIIKPTKQDKTYNYLYDDFQVFCFPIKKIPTKRELSGLDAPSGITEFTELLKQINPDILHLHSLGRALNTQHLKIANQLNIKTIFTSHLASTFCFKADFNYFGKQCDGHVKHKKCLECFVATKYPNLILKKMFVNVITNKLVHKLLVKFIPALNVINYKQQELNYLKTIVSQNIAISQWKIEMFTNNGITNFSLISQAINTDNFKQTNTDNIFKSKQLKDKIYLTFIGRMMSIKGIHLIINALSKIRDSKFVFYICYVKGEDNYFAKINNLIQQNNIAVEYFENLNTLQINQLLEASNFLCLATTIYETAPLVVLEAFAKKIPVIGTNKGGIRDMITHNYNGYLFDNEQELTDILQQINDSPEIFYALQKNIAQPKNIQTLALEHIKIYN